MSVEKMDACDGRSNSRVVEGMSRQRLVCVVAARAALETDVAGHTDILGHEELAVGPSNDERRRSPCVVRDFSLGYQLQPIRTC